VNPEASALLELGRLLQHHDYEFVTITPSSHRRVNERAARSGREAAVTLRDVFGWNRPFERAALPSEMFALLKAANAVERAGDGFRSLVRYSTLRGRLFVHSSFPTQDQDAVFFGPDTYRFCALLERWGLPARRVVDIGCGTGAGGLIAGANAQELTLADVSARALRFAEINAALAATKASFVESDVLRAVDGEFDLIIANPPYMLDPAARTYRDGGGAFGEALSLRIVREAIERLAVHGTLIVYTGAAVVEGVDQFWKSVQPLLDQRDLLVTYEELDPDVFGEELEQAHYAHVERIAAVGLRVRRNERP
jgi:methylase of polypeptide subunit release factors